MSITVVFRNIFLTLSRLYIIYEFLRSVFRWESWLKFIRSLRSPHSSPCNPMQTYNCFKKGQTNIFISYYHISLINYNIKILFFCLRVPSQRYSRRSKSADAERTTSNQRSSSAVQRSSSTNQRSSSNGNSAIKSSNK